LAALAVPLHEQRTAKSREALAFPRSWGDGAEEPITKILDVLLLQAAAQRYPRRHDELKALASLPKSIRLANLLAFILDAS
jgi:hypothetical protein